MAYHLEVSFREVRLCTEVLNLRIKVRLNRTQKQKSFKECVIIQMKTLEPGSRYRSCPRRPQYTSLLSLAHTPITLTSLLCTKPSHPRRGGVPPPDADECCHYPGVWCMQAKKVKNLRFVISTYLPMNSRCVVGVSLLQANLPIDVPNHSVLSPRHFGDRLP